MQADARAARSALRPAAGARFSFRVRLRSPRFSPRPFRLHPTSASKQSIPGVDAAKSFMRDDGRAFARRSDQGRAQPDQAALPLPLRSSARLGKITPAAAAQGICRGDRAAPAESCRGCVRWPWRRPRLARSSSLRPLRAGSSFPRLRSPPGRWWRRARLLRRVRNRIRRSRRLRATTNRSRRLRAMTD